MYFGQILAMKVGAAEAPSFYLGVIRGSLPLFERGCFGSARDGGQLGAGRQKGAEARG